MGEWSDHFEDFPEENPTNYFDGHYDPQGVARARAQRAGANRARVLEQQKELDTEIKRIIEKHCPVKK